MEPPACSEGGRQEAEKQRHLMGLDECFPSPPSSLLIGRSNAMNVHVYVTVAICLIEGMG